MTKIPEPGWKRFPDRLADESAAGRFLWGPDAPGEAALRPGRGAAERTDLSREEDHET